MNFRKQANSSTVGFLKTSHFQGQLETEYYDS